jgi:hypothetical protein
VQPKVRPLLTSSICRSSSIFIFVRLSSSNVYIQHLHNQCEMKRDQLGRVVDTIACATGMMRQITIESLRATYVAYCRVAHVRGMLRDKEARDKVGTKCCCRAWRVVLRHCSGLCHYRESTHDTPMRTVMKVFHTHIHKKFTNEGFEQISDVIPTLRVIHRSSGR